jgi:hypothetical protein
VGSSPASGSRLPPAVLAQNVRMSEHTDATDDLDDEAIEPADEDDPDADGPQPWAKALPGNEDE